MKIELAEQVRQFLRDCPPEPRRWLRDALRKLADERGDIKAMEGELTGYYRMRVRSYRIIFRYRPGKGERAILCDFAEHRGVVYEAFMRVLEG